MLQVHAVASVFPDMSADEFDALKSDIAANGQREPIWLHEGRIIDGRHRYRACQELGIEPATRTWDGDGSLVAFIVSLNLHRRSLNPSQRAMIAQDVLPMLEAEAKVQQKLGGHSAGRGRPKQVEEKIPQPIRSDQSRDEAAKLLNTNPRYVSDAKKIVEKAPDLAAEVRSGAKKITQAKNELRKREQRAEAKVKASKSQPLLGGYELIAEDVNKHLDKMLVRSKEGERPRLIIADPPYNLGVDYYGRGAKADRMPPEQYMLWVKDWIDQCRDILLKDGSLWIIISDEFAAEYAIAIKRSSMTLVSWIKWVEGFGVACSGKFNRTSRHIFYAVKDSKKRVFNTDAVSCKSDREVKYRDRRAAPGGKIWDDVWHIPRLTGTCNERWHDAVTQLPLALVRPIVECASDPGDLVLDPFCGSGTTGVAAIETGRRFLGLDISRAAIRLAQERLAAASFSSRSKNPVV